MKAAGDPFKDFRQQAHRLVAKMTLEEKASLLSGLDFWHTKPLARLDVPSVLVTDGPHGLRKQDKPDHLGITQASPATCFPTAVTTACSFDRELLREMGVALGEECLEEEVAVILGPGANIKRSPLCGRNFEYFSEDPYLTGETAAALIDGIQSKNVGVSLKHFLANNQERARMASSSVIDERALREIYLAGFETAIRKTQPWTLMCSYNKINGVYASDNKRLMTDVPRDEWGYNGLIMSDWGAMNNRVEAVRAGLDLEMPYCGGTGDRQIVAAVRAEKLDVKLVNRCAENVVMLALKASLNKKVPFNHPAHHELARRIARESAVLLKNGGALPAAKKAKIAVIGEFAKTPRYQGSGSSRLNPSKMTTVLDAFDGYSVQYVYSEGYELSSDAPNANRIAEAVGVAIDADVVFAFVGLPDRYESEGFDRVSLDLPEAHNKLIEALAEVNKNVVAVIFAGGAVVLPWRDKVNAILLMGLPGQNNGSAAYDLLLGDYSPCGKLAETWPLKLLDTPSYAHFGSVRNVEYRESVYVGYRYYDKAEKEVAYPFGYGLSYSSFDYTDLTLDKKRLSGSENLSVSVTVKNTGSCEAKEIVELYVSPPETALFKPVRELRGYEKVSLKPDEQCTVRFMLETRAFSYYNTAIGGWAVENGDYGIEIGASSRHILLRESVTVETAEEAPIPDYRQSAPGYYHLTTGDIPKEQFEAVYGGTLPPEPPLRPFRPNSTLSDIRASFIGRILYRILRVVATKVLGGDVDSMWSQMLDMPLRSLAMMSDGVMSLEKVDGLVDILNGKLLRGIRKLMQK